MKTNQYILSAVVPLFNEGAGLNTFHKSLLLVLEDIAPNAFEIIYCDDGSTDNAVDLITQFHDQNNCVKLIKLSRNFGKESALAAGISVAKGQAVDLLVIHI